MLPYIIGAAIAVILLIVIHFFGLRLRQKIDFSHLQFLTALISQTKSVRRINNYLLLGVRTIFVASALAAFLLFFSQSSNPKSLSVANVIVDNSWSMLSPSLEGTQTKEELAKTDAKGLKASSELDNKPSSNNKGAALPKESGPALTSSSDLFNQVMDQKRSSQTFILSDFQKSSFPKTAFKNLSEDLNVTLIRYPSSEGVVNLFIDSVWLDVPILLPGRLADISVRVGGSLLEEETQVKITASAGDNLIGATQVLLKPGDKVTTRFKVPTSNQEALPITFSVEDHHTTFDNQFYAVLPKPALIRVNFKNGVGDKNPIGNAYKAEPGFKISSGGLDGADVKVVELNENGNGLPPASSTKSWIEKGGSLVLIPSASNQNSLLTFLNEIGIKEIKEENKEAAAKTLKQPDFSDSFFKPVFEKEVKNMTMPEAKPVLTWRSAFHHILRFTDNSPFLSSFRIGKGQVFLFSLPIKGSAFVNHPLFVPVFYQLALGSAAGPAVLAYQPVNKTIQVPLVANEKSQKPYTLSRNGQVFVPDQKVVQSQLILTLPEELSQPGFYALAREDKAINQIALNIPRGESQLEAYSIDELKELVQEEGGRVKVLEASEPLAGQKQMQKEANGITLWKYCLILCFLCLFMEAIILSAKKRGSLIQSGYDS
jgi:hypothetical protein